MALASLSVRYVWIAIIAASAAPPIYVSRRFSVAIYVADYG
jgi:hypothetical protein